MLSQKNAHERDNHIVFYEHSHKYEIDGISKGYTSVTSFIHSLFPQFDADKVIEKMKAGPNWSSSKYFGKTDEDIKNEWNCNKNASSSRGTNLHHAIELFLNNEPLEKDSSIQTTIEWSHFIKFWEKFSVDYEPYRTEWYIWSKEYGIAGSIDCIMRRKSDGKFVMLDWKRTKEIKTSNPYENGFPPLEHIPNCNYWHYTLQLNIYRTILEKYYNIVIDEMYLLILHPNSPSYCQMRLNRLENEIDELFSLV